MNFPAFDSSRFPPRPAHRFATAPIYLEPMVGSGERLCVLAAVQGESGADAAAMISLDMAECLYGAQAKSLMGFIEILRADLQRHFAAGLPLAGWVPILEGARLGAVVEARADDVPMAVRLVARSHASLCHLAALGGVDADEPATSVRDEALKAWIAQVQDLAAGRDPGIIRHFNRRIDLIGEDPVVLPWASETSALHFGLVTPAKLAHRTNDAKLKLWNLEHLPDGYAERGIVLGIPRDDAPDMAERRVREKIAGRIEALHTQAERSGVAVVTVHTAAEAAERIVQAEAA
jgi:hypothetical protein